MRIVPRYEAFFLILYALLIVLVGILVYSMTGHSEVLIILSLLLVFYLILSIRKPLRRRRAAEAEFPGEWRGFLVSRSPFYHGLKSEGRARFERDVLLFLADTRIAGTGGAPVSWQTRLLVAAGAAAMLHGRPDWEPPLRDGVTIYPGYSFDRNYRAGQGKIAGQAPPRGPLLVAEKSLHEGFADGKDGYNVIVHELAHYFDLEARKGGLRIVLADGKESSWGDAIEREFRAHDFAASVLPAYAARNEAEFFACAGEMFFEDPRRLAEVHRNLFSLLAQFFNQDPRSILEPGAAN